MYKTLCIIGGLVLTACATPEPPTMEQAMVSCTERARDAVGGPDVSVGIQIGSGGKVSTGVGISVSGDQLSGRDPAEVYEACVISKTGQKPAEPLKL